MRGLHELPAGELAIMDSGVSHGHESFDRYCRDKREDWLQSQANDLHAFISDGVKLAGEVYSVLPDWWLDRLEELTKKYPR